MVAIFTGVGTGLERGSGSVLGGRGQIGAASFGRASENVYVNAASGNLVVTHQDEFLLGLGPDVSISRSHNSQRTGDSDNNDAWRASFNRKIWLSGAYGAVGSQAQRMDWDGGETWYDWDSAQNAYVLTGGAGAHDKLTRSGTVWTWIDGDSRVTELYDENRGGLITRTTDADGNALSYDYETASNGLAHIKRISVLNAAGVEVERVDAVYDNLKLTHLVTTKADGTSLTRARYGYETYNGGAATRLVSVEVDLSPADNSVADGNKYVLTYTYADTSSVRIASIAQSDGSQLSITYDASGRVTSLTELISAGVTSATTIAYYSGYSTVTDATGGVTTLYYDAKGQLTQITQPPASTGAAPQTTSFAYNANGDVISTTDALGNSSTFTYDSNGNMLTETGRLGNVVTRTYGAQNQLLTETRNGSDADGADAPHTTRFAYDAENHLRYVVSAEGEVTEYRYAAAGQRVAELVYAESSYSLAGLGSGQAISEASLNNWVSALSDKSSVQRTNTYYDARGAVSSVVSYSSASRFGEGAESPLAIAAGSNTTIEQQSDGLYRVTKTSGSGGDWDADAHSLMKMEGDFVLRLRPAQTDKYVIGGMSAAPAGSASYTNLDYGFYFVYGGPLYYMEKGVYEYMGVYFNAGDNLWLSRTGSTINYYKGATLEAAMAAGALRTRTGSTEALYFDSAFYTTGGALDVGLTPLGVTNGVNTTVTAQADGLYRVTKTSGGTWSWDGDARSTTKADGDFVLRLRPGQNNSHMVGGVATSPAASASYTNPDYGLYFLADGTVQYMEAGSYASLGVSYKAGDNFWVVRSGSSISYYKGATLEAAMAAGALRTRTGVSGTYYFDSSFNSTGAVMDVAFTPQPIVNGVNTSVVSLGDGLQRVTKTGGSGWDSDARSTSRADGDFTLRLRPGQGGVHMVGGVATLPGASASYTNPDYGFYFEGSGTVFYMEAGSYASLGVSYAAGDNFWLVRSGTTIGYYKGATLEAAMAAGALRTRTGVGGTFHFDSSLHSAGSFMDVSFAPREAGGASADFSRTNFVYDQSGRLLSRMTDGQLAETFVYDGLGRLTATTDRNQGTTNIVFNDAATQTVVTLASGLVKTSTYNKSGDLISTTESGSYVAGGTTTSKYDKLGRLRQTTDGAGFKKYFVYDKVGRLVAEVNHRGDLIEYRYDANDRLIATARYINTITGANLTTLADPNSTIEMSALRPSWHPWDVWNWTTYDKEGRVTSTMDGTIRTYEYDKSGRLVKTVAYYNGLDWNQIVAFQTNPPTAPVIPAADARDAVSRNFYDKEGRLLAALNAEGYLTRNIYDRAGQLVEKVAYLNASAAAYRASGTLAQLIANQATDANDRRTRLVYDGQGLLRFEVDGFNQVVEYGYNSAQQLISTVSYAGSIAATSDYTYDNIKALAVASGLASAAATRKSWNVYDGSGRVAYAIGAEGAVSALSYDNLGQVIKTVEFAVARPTTSAPDFATMSSWTLGQNGNAANRVTRYYYNARGELRFTVDAEGYVTRSDYDAAGRTVGEYRWSNIVSVGDASTIANVDALQGGVWTGNSYGYEFGGPLTDVTNAEGNWNRSVYLSTGQKLLEYNVYADSNYTYYNYSTFGQLVARTDANGAPEAATVQYGYDGHGNLKTVVDARGNAANRTFDKLGRVLTETDALGGVVSYEYNAFGEVTKVTDARGYATTSAYDKLGRLVSTTDALNHVTTHTYNVFGDLLTVTRGLATTTFEYDRLGRVIKTTDAEGHYELYTLDAWGNRLTVRNKIGGIVTNAYDRRGLLVAEILPMASYDSNGNLLTSSVTNKFEYDARGNRTKKIEAFGLPEARTTTYIYDRADRLVETRGDAVSTMNADWVNSTTLTPSEKLKYDHRGRVTERTDALGGRTLYYYDQMGRVKVELGAAGAYTAFTYDQNGNVLTRRVYATAVALPGTAGGTPPAAPGGEYREIGYTYDALNRLKTTTVAGIRTGYWYNGVYVTTASSHSTTTLDYDSNGNVVRTVDGNGALAYAYYDKNNRKIAEVDREGYLTALFLDGEGNVVQEVRYATRVTGATTASDPEALRNSVSGGGARVTSFDYDKNGRRRFETRVGVNSHALDGSGNLVGGAANATIEYSYNGLGEVVQKTEANGDYVSYAYDATGRLIQENRAPYLDQNGASVRPTVAYSYNGINELSLTRQGGVAAAAGDRYTRYTYGAGGRLATMTDANGAAYTYYYDLAGNVMRESYLRYKADGNYTIDSLLYTRDQLGRVTSQGLASWNGSAWVHGDRQGTAFNAYGDVAQRGVNGLWQEQLTYDTAGRLVKSNSGDGVWRFFAYDASGNQTLALESEGGDYAGYTVDQAIAAATAGGSVGGAYVDNINATIAVFDNRGQQVATHLPFRQLSASVTQTLTSARTYNAYGEVTAETDARGYTTYFAYDSMGRLKQKALPTVNYTSASGAVASAQPIESYYYDVAGRMIATDDANGNRIRRALLAGTGHGGSEAMVTAEYHPDGGVFRTYYDVFGDARILRDELGYDEYRTYDAMSRLTQQTHRGGLLTDYYAYDLLGQRTSHYNSALGAGNLEVTDYDMQGRVTRNVTFGGDTTTTSYSWNGAIATAGMGTFGGWSKTVSRAGASSTHQTDLFGRDVYKADFGGHAYYYSYDKAGRLIAQTGPVSQTQTYSYFNTNRAYQIVDTAGSGLNAITATFGYNANGNRTYEGYAGTVYAYHYGNYHLSGYQTLQNATIDYDALGRITAFTDRDGGGTTRITFTTEYDLVGNVRHSTSSFPNIAYPQYTNYLTNDWFLYDSMNRMTLTGGDLVGGAIVRGQDGVSITYDAAGRRRTATHGVALTGYAEVWVPDGGYGPPYEYEVPIGGENGHWETQQSNYWGDRREEYDYRADGYLTDIRFADEGYYDTGNSYVLANGTMGAAVLRATNSRDYLGRVTQYREFDAYGYTTYDRYSIVYDGASRVTSEALSQKKLESGAPHTYLTYTVNTYAGPGGALSYSTADNYRDGSDSGSLDTSTSYSYAWWSDAMVSSSTHDSDSGSGSNTLWTSSYYYDGLGRLASVDIADGRRRSVSFASNTNGQTLSRIERSAVTNNPNDFYYFVDGAQVGEMTNNGNYDPTRIDYSNTFVTRNWTANPVSAPFRWNTQGGVTAGQFGGSGYDPISPTSNGMSGTDGRYQVREGDTLAGIAASVWGDASLWYMIAEANGLSGNQSLPAGTSLIIPDKVTNVHNSARTFEVYDPNRALGDLSPTAAKPPKKAGKCGMFGQILLVVIAVAVTALSYGSLSAAMGPILGGALAGAAGSVASQAFGVATGIQDKFSFKAVAMAAIAGGVGGGVGQVLGKGSLFGSQFLGDVIRGAAGSAITQGIGVAVGLQKKFDFAAVAAAGIGAGIGGAFKRDVLNIRGEFAKSTLGYAQQGATSMASALANAATRSIANGSDFGDNLLAALPDIIGSTIGNMVADGVQARLARNRTESGAGGTPQTSGTAQAGAGLGNGAAADPVAGAGGGQVSIDAFEERTNDIIVTARQSTGALRSVLQNLQTQRVEQWSALRHSLDSGVPIQGGGGTGTLRAFGDIPGGPVDPNDTLAGGINIYAFFGEGTADDLAAWLLGNGLIEDSDVGVADAVERIDMETEGNDYMLSGNIAALYATGNARLIEVARGLQEVALDRWDEYGADGAAAADAAVEDILRINPIIDEILFARDVVQGNASNTEIGVRAGAHALPIVGGAIARTVARTEGRMARVSRLGREGERIAGVTGPKVGIRMNGRMRFPDGLDREARILTEVKNVRYQGYSRQLRDYVEYAREHGYTMNLFVREGTTLSRPLQAAAARGDLNILRRLPNPR